MSLPDVSGSQLEIGHVLFIDIVGYSTLLIEEQKERVRQLTDVVLASPQVEKSTNEQLVRLPTGDGMGLVFRNSSEEPARSALEIAQALQTHPEIAVRMGIHSGPVSEVTDISGRANLAGAGVNMAQRVMDCGDAGHILLSKHVAEDLGHYRQWSPMLHDLGECEVKHGVRLGLFNLHTGELGNPTVPAKLRKQRRKGKRRPPLAARVPAPPRSRWVLPLVFAGIILLCALCAGWWVFGRQSPNGEAAREPMAIPEKSVAVLPFENLSSDKENAYFADGVQDEILTDLAKIADLKVISRSSVMQYRSGIARNLREIGRQLGVAHLLEGSVQRAEGKVRVNAQLIDARTDAHLWAQTYDRGLSDIFAIQSDIARAIAEQLQAKLAPEEQTRLVTKPTENTEAYLLYLQANELVYVAASRQDAINADKVYAQAIALDPSFALAQARASTFNSLMYFIGRAPERKIRARALADEALRLAPSLGEAHLALGLCYYRIDGDYKGALKELAIARVASPNDAEIIDSSGYIYRRQGRWRDALAAFTRARQLDPRRAHFDGAPDTLRLLRQWEAASDVYQQGLQLEPQLLDGWTGLAYVQFAQSGSPAPARATLERLAETMKGKGAMEQSWDYAMMARDFSAAEAMLPNIPANDFPGIEARPFYEGCVAFVRGDLVRARSDFEQIRPEYEAARRDHPDDPTFHARLARLYALLGRKEEAIREGRRAVELCPEEGDAIDGPIYATNLAFVYAQTGEVEPAVTLLARLLTTPGADRVTLAHLRLSWEWDPLRQDPSFKALVAGPEPATVYK